MNQITLPLDTDSLKVISQSLDVEGSIVLEVISRKSEATCHECGKPATKRYGTAPVIKVRHLPILNTPVYLSILPVRYQCEHYDDHSITTAQYDWCDRKSHITKGLERYLMCNLIHSIVQDVSRKKVVSYKTLTSALSRQVNQQIGWSEHKELNTIGIDEISMKKGHQDYVTIISVRTKSDKLSVIAVLPDRLKTTVHQFLESIPDHLIKTVKTVCTGMYDGFVQATVETFGNKVVALDRYHVSKLYRELLDKLRIQEMNHLKSELSSEEYAKPEGVMWIIRKNHDCLSKDDKVKLEVLFIHSPNLHKAHSYALKLTYIFNTKSSRKSGLSKINRWITNIKKSGVHCFDKFIGTLQKYKSSIINYFKARKNSGFVEGLTNKIKVAKRRCYGFFKIESLFQRLQVNLRGFKIYA